LDRESVATRLTATPTAATAISVAPWTFTGWANRSIASNVTRAATTINVMPFPAAARISALFMPNVCDPVSGRAAMFIASSEPPIAPTSASMCPASAKSAKECARTAASTSKTMKAARSTSVTVRYLWSDPGPTW
jgi:hypothetical protein